MFDAITIAMGFAGYVFLALIYNAASIVYGIASYIGTVIGGSPQTSL